MKGFLLLVSVMLFIAFLPMPYVYYTILKIVGTIAWILIAFTEYKSGGLSLWFFIAICGVMLINPIISPPITKSIWMIINLIMGIAMAYYASSKLRTRQFKNFFKW
ncbi:MAG: hypothetical protein H7X79_09030 [Sporomusaceae bacterium]|nr:hypothetical protein [Sporomusaceae bacterium]